MVNMCMLYVRYLVILLVFRVVISAVDLPPRVNPPCGPLSGKYIQTRNGRKIASFLGIPFAKPPIGDLRFEPPQPVDPWIDERPAVSQPPRCPQPLTINNSEDCLYLNVYTPNPRRRGNLPVLVFFFGSDYELGDAEYYTAEYLLDEDLLFVVMQHRLGLLGFFSTGNEVVPGNMGLKDLRLGLRWVRDNIRSFGGDPSKVTIYGESSGAVTVHQFMSFIDDEGLFRAGISSSGSGLCPWGIRPPGEVKRIVESLAALSGCPSDSNGIVSCLRSKTVEELVTLYTIEYKNTMYPPTVAVFTQFPPLIGPVVEPNCVQDRIISSNPWGRNTTLPWLVGVNSKESLFYFTAQINDRTEVGFATVNSVFDIVFPQLLNYQNSDADGLVTTEAAREFYLNNLPISRLNLPRSVDLLSHGYFVYPVYEAVLRSNMRQTYLYLFDYVGVNQISAIPPDGRIGVSHGEELLFLFSHPGLIGHVPRLPDTESDIQLSYALVQLFTNFITCLEPTPKHCTVQWPPYSVNQSYIHFKQEGMQIENGFLPEDMAFWQSHPYPNRDDDYGEVTCQFE